MCGGGGGGEGDDDQSAFQTNDLHSQPTSRGGYEAKQACEK